MLGANLVEPLEQRNLGVLVFDDGLDNEIGFLEVFEGGGRIDAPHDIVAFFGLEAAALNHTIQIARDRLTSARDEVLRNIVEQDLDPGLCRDLRDTGAHLTGSNHPHCPDTHPRPPRKNLIAPRVISRSSVADHQRRARAVLETDRLALVDPEGSGTATLPKATKRGVRIAASLHR